jgi:hypothetical protein
MKNKKLCAFNGDVNIKNNILIQLKNHYDNKQIIKSRGFDNEKGGGAIECIIHEEAYYKLQTNLGIPLTLGYVINNIYHGLQDKYLSQNLPFKFIESICVGADLTLVWPKFALWLIKDEKYGFSKFFKSSRKKNDLITYVINLYDRVIKNDNINNDEWQHISDMCFEHASKSDDFFYNLYYLTYVYAYPYADKKMSSNKLIRDSDFAAGYVWSHRISALHKKNGEIINLDDVYNLQMSELLRLISLSKN